MISYRGQKCREQAAIAVPSFGTIFDDIGEGIADAADAVKDVASSIADAGDLIGGVLKSVSPVLSMVPGLGTAFAVAIYAAGAVTAGDRVDDIVIGSASAAMPPGIPRIAFDSGVNITRDIAEGRNVLDSTLNACRAAANHAGGPQAVAAFDAGVAVAKGGKVDQRLIDAGRKYALDGGGEAAAASYDAGVAIAQGKEYDQVMLDVARSYIRDMGGPTAAAAFDAGTALAYGKTLQDAGFAGLKTFAKGNDPVEKIIRFVETVGRAKSLRMGVQELLESDLGHDVRAAFGKASVSLPNLPEQLQPMMDEFAKHRELLDTPAGQLAQEWLIDEAKIRAAQAVMRNGEPDTALLTKLAAAPIGTVGRMDMGGDIPPDVKGRNDALAAEGWRMAHVDPEIMGARTPKGREGLSLTLYRQDLYQRGFDIGSASSKTPLATPEEAAIKASLKGFNQADGFGAAADLQHRKQVLKAAALAAWRAQLFKSTVASATATGTQALMSEQGKLIAAKKAEALKAQEWADLQTKLNTLANMGVELAKGDPRIGRARASAPVGQFRQGFDIAIGLCSGTTAPASEQYQVLARLAPEAGGTKEAVSGFQLGQALSFGIAKQMFQAGALPIHTDPGRAVGQLVTSGLNGSALPAAQKTATMETLVGSPAARQGAQDAIRAIATPKGLLARIREFLFGRH